MKTIVLLVFAVLFIGPLPAFAASGGQNSGGDAADSPVAAKIRIVFDNSEVIVSLFDSPASRELLSQLPLTLPFRDFSGTEKIANLPRPLHTAGSSTPHEFTGDFAYFPPWGNLAVFYQGFGSSDQVVILGRIETGKERLAAMKNSFTAKMEILEKHFAKQP